MITVATDDYCWPRTDLGDDQEWHSSGDGLARVRELPETAERLAADSRWPAMFPAPMCLVSTADRSGHGLEKVVGPSIVNRFPYVMALSFCRERLSERHHPRREFMNMLERGGGVVVQFLPPGPLTDAAMQAVQSVPEEHTRRRIAATGLPVRQALTNDAPVFDDAYLAYEARLVSPKRDFEGRSVHERPWIDVGSHRVYFLEINAIQLRRDIAEGRTRIRWRSLPRWQPRLELQPRPPSVADEVAGNGRYAKGFTPDYRFPSAGTVAFEADAIRSGMTIKHLPPLPDDQVEIDNDRARWPCFFPSSLGMITTWHTDGVPNAMPCGSTMVISRHPLVIAPCVSYAAINERYAPRATLRAIRRTGRFGCGVPFVHDTIVSAITHTGNHSVADDPSKVARAGLAVEADDWAPVLPALPIHFDCEVVDELPLGTHVMFMGQVRRIRVRADVTPDAPIRWRPWAELEKTE